MYKVIINGTEQIECSAFEEQYDGFNQSQTLQFTNKEVPHDFLSTWSTIAKTNPIKTVEIQFNNQTMVSYDYYNMIQFVTVRPIPESTILEGVVVLVHREIDE